MNSFIARQPIFDAEKKLFAYELLFRTGMSNAYPNIDGSTATSSLLSSSFLTTGIDSISNGKIVFINFTEELLIRGIPMLFPDDKIIIEILEDVIPTDAIVVACQNLKLKGYSLALDDFVYQKNLIPLIKLARFIKADFRLTPIMEIVKLISTLKEYQCSLLAEKIETYDEFQKAKELGFRYFQGYFFARPEILKNKEISASQLSLIKLICEINKEGFDIDRLETIIRQDVSISFKLFKYLNSSYFYRVHPVSSINQAIAFLGENGIRLFVSLIVASKLAKGKPSELIRTSLIRANVLSSIGKELEIQGSELFMLGLFSLVDAMLDNSMNNLVRQLPLSPAIKKALVEREGKLFPFLNLIESYERCKWESIENEIERLNIGPDRLTGFYLEAVKMADQLEAI